MAKRNLLAGFEEMAAAQKAEQPRDDDQHYPGSKQKKRSVTKRQPKGGWEDIPKLSYGVGDEIIDFYTVGTLAEMLGRKAQTIRKWENLGYIPESRFRTPGRTKHGQKRIYTRPMIEGIVKIAHEEGIVGNTTNRNVSATKFAERVTALFKEMGVLG